MSRPAGDHASRQRGFRRDEGAASDFVGTILMVLVVVALGSVLAVVVVATLSVPSPTPASFSMLGAEPGDTTLRILYKNGEPIPLSTLRVSLARNETRADVPMEGITVPDAAALRPGDVLSLALAPALGEDERLRVDLMRADENVLLGELAARVGHATARIPTGAIQAAFTPVNVTADGVTANLLEARVSHPWGALAVATVRVDLSNVTRAAGAGMLSQELRDDGQEGDRVGGDGVWSALVRLPSGTPTATYVFTLNATGADGALVATNTTMAKVTGGVCVGCAVQTGGRAYEGTRLRVPASANVSKFALVNWTWDRRHPDRLEDDAMVVRVVANGSAWSAHFTFGYTSTANTPAIKRMLVWTEGNETVYVPRNGTYLPLQGLSLDLLDPEASLQLVRASGSPHPSALYRNAALWDDPTFMLTYLRDEDPTGQSQQALSIGIYAADVVVS